MKFEENWPMGYRGEVVQRCEQTDNGRWTDNDRRQVISIAHQPCSGELKSHKNELSIMPKSLAYLQTMIKEPAKFQIVGIKLYEGLRTQGTHHLSSNA